MSRVGPARCARRPSPLLSVLVVQLRQDAEGVTGGAVAQGVLPAVERARVDQLVQGLLQGRPRAGGSRLSENRVQPQHAPEDPPGPELHLQRPEKLALLGREGRRDAPAGLLGLEGLGLGQLALHRLEHEPVEVAAAQVAEAVEQDHTAAVLHLDDLARLGRAGQEGHPAPVDPENLGHPRGHAGARSPVDVDLDVRTGLRREAADLGERRLGREGLAHLGEEGGELVVAEGACPGRVEPRVVGLVLPLLAGGAVVDDGADLRGREPREDAQVDD